MWVYERMAILSQLNEDLKEYNSDYSKTKNLIRHNTIQLLKQEKDEPRNQMLRVFKIAEKEAIKDYEKSVLVDRRRLSDWSLECVYRAPDGTIRVDNIQENTSDYEYEGAWERSKARDEKIENEQKKFNSYWNSWKAPVAGVKEVKKVSRLN